MTRQLINLVGERFGCWEVISYASTSRWLCRCTCGTEREVDGATLRNGSSASCGHDIGRGKRRHGDYRTKLWNTWRGMCNRVTPNYRNGRWYRLGMHEPWRDYVIFRDYVLSTIGPHPGDSYSLDRINNEVGYFPGNIRWATAAQQMANRSPSQEGQPA